MCWQFKITLKIHKLVMSRRTPRTYSEIGGAVPIMISPYFWIYELSKPMKMGLDRSMLSGKLVQQINKAAMSSRLLVPRPPKSNLPMPLATKHPFDQKKIKDWQKSLNGLKIEACMIVTLFTVFRKFLVEFFFLINMVVLISLRVLQLILRILKLIII